MEFIQRVINVIQEEINKIESILDEFGDDNFFKLASEQGGLEKVLACALEVAKVQDSIVLKSEYYGALQYKTLVIPDAEQGFIASIPDLPGCLSSGKTEEEALAKLKKVKAMWIENAINRLQPIPNPSNDE